MGEFLVAGWRVEPSLNCITTRDGKKVLVEPKAIEVLLCLVRNAGEVISKKKIIKAVGSDTYVSDGVLTYCISELRKAFRDGA
jgi:DNA-binding winged helix-turn-helix (wHTH) protein